MGHKFKSREAIVYDAAAVGVHVIIHLSRPIEYTTLRVNPTDFGAIVM